MPSSYEMRKKFFNDRAESWLDTFYKDEQTGSYTKYGKEFIRLFSLLHIQKRDIVLDAGCGCGILVPYILNQVGEKGHLYELDYAEQMIAINRQLHKDPRITFLTADILDNPLKESSCDVVICFACFPHIENKEKGLLSIAKVLKKGGTLAIAHLNSSQEINDHHRKCAEVIHDKLPLSKEMKNLFHNTGLRIGTFIDEPGFYFISGKKK
jgi:ubiquinone/menaquinone biosynthesis C-methylase UbiE